METFDKHAEINDPEDQTKEQVAKESESAPAKPSKRVAPADGLTKRVASSDEANLDRRPSDDQDTPEEQPEPARRTILVIGAASFLGVLLVFAIIWQAGSFVNNRGVFATPIPQATTAPTHVTGGSTIAPTTAPITAVPTAATMTPTPDPRVRNALNYTDGLAAYDRHDWKQAAELFQKVYDSDSAYLDIQEKLSATYYNWGMQLLNPQSAAEALEKFQATVNINQGHQLAREQLQRLMRYLDARDTETQRDWSARIATFEDLQGFLDSVDLLYRAYMNYSAELDRQKQYQEELHNCQQAAELKVKDTAEADNCVKRVMPLLGRMFIAYGVRSYQKVSSSTGLFASCVSGRVVDKNNKGIDGAVVGVNNGPVNKFTDTTKYGGYYKICNLGASSWTAVLFYIPTKPGIGNQPRATVNVNGDASQEAIVNFLERRP